MKPGQPFELLPYTIIARNIQKVKHFLCQLMKYLQPTVWLPAAFLYLYVLSIHLKGVFVNGNSQNVNSHSSLKGRRQPWDVALM